MARRPGRVPRAAQDAPQRARAPAADPAPSAWTRPSTAVGIDRDRRPQTLAVGEWLALAEALGDIPEARSATSTAMTADPARRLEPVVRLAPGQGQPDARGRWARGPTASTTCTASWSRSTSRTGSRSPSLPPGRDGQPPRRRASTPVRSPTTSSCGRSPPPAVPPGPSGAARSRRRRSPPRLEKRIPVAAGLAGGSSDAAAAADAALEAWGVTLDRGARHGCAAGSGSDVPFFLAGGPALVEGRGERLTPLPWLRDADRTHDRPGAAPRHARRAGSPRRRRSGPGTRARGVAGGAARTGVRAPRRGAARRGCGSADLLARASVLAAANDLAPAAAVVEPGLVPFKRALLRLLGRPVGMSGSGPTHWALYPSHAEAAAAAEAVRAAIAAGDLPAPGPHEPFVAATRIRPPSARPAAAAPEGAMTRQAISTERRPGRHRPVQPGHRDRRPRVLQRPARASTRRPASSSRGASRRRPSGRCAT